MHNQVEQVFDRALVRKARNRSKPSFNDHDFLFEWTEKALLERLEDIKRDFDTILMAGARNTGLIEKAFKEKRVFTSDLAERFLKSDRSVIADEECLPFKDDCFDLILSPLCLHSTNDLPGALIQFNRTLKADGLFMGAMFGGETLFELKDALMRAEMGIYGGVSPHISPFADKQQMGALMQRAQFALPVIDSEIITVSYESLDKLLYDIRYMGEANTLIDRKRKPFTRALFEQTESIYKKLYSESDGRLIAHFEIIFLLGWAPHQSQQKPLRPGSAKNRLSDVLGTDEINTGVKVS